MSLINAGIAQNIRHARWQRVTFGLRQYRQDLILRNAVRRHSGAKREQAGERKRHSSISYACYRLCARQTLP
jgi:hypothetical protein